MSIIKDYGACNVSIAPLRAEPNDTSEMVSQLLFGDYVKIIEIGEPWIKVYFPADHYEGWMDFKQLKYLDAEYFDLNANKKHPVLTEGTIKIKGPQGVQHIIFGSNLPNYSENKLHLGDDEYTLIDTIKLYTKNFTETAITYLNTPYLWGGKGIFGIDCSGLTQMVAKIHNIKLPRDCSKQVDVGKTISFENRKSGDLMYFINDNKAIHHVGILIDENRIIHASGHVRIDRFDEKGIYRDDLKKYTHHYHRTKRI